MSELTDRVDRLGDDINKSVAAIDAALTHTQQLEAQLQTLRAHPLIEIINIQGQPVLIVVDRDAGIPLDTWTRMDLPPESPLRGCPVVSRRTGTTVEVWDRARFMEALAQLPPHVQQQIVDDLIAHLVTLGGERIVSLRAD